MNLIRKICLIISEIVLTACFLFSVLLMSDSIQSRAVTDYEIIMTVSLFVLSVTGLVMARHEGRTVMILIMLHYLLHIIFMSLLTAALIISEQITEWVLYSILLIPSVVLLVLSVAFLIRWRRYTGKVIKSHIPFIVYSAAFMSAAAVMWMKLASIKAYDDIKLQLLSIAVAFMALLSIVMLSVYVSGGAHPDNTEEKGADDV